MADLSAPENPQRTESATVDVKTEAFVESQKRSLFLRTGDKVAEWWPEVLTGGVTLGAGALLSTSINGAEPVLRDPTFLVFLGIPVAVSFMSGWSRGEMQEKEHQAQAGNNTTAQDKTV